MAVFDIPARRRLLAIGLMILGGLVPLVLHWWFLGRLPTVTPEVAKELLAQPETAAVLIDVRTAEQYAQKHLEAAQNWPYQEIACLASADEMPAVYKNKHLLCLCDSGILSGAAVAKLRGLGIAQVSNVHGGMQEWIASGSQSCPLGLCRLVLTGGKVDGLPVRESPSLEQWLVVGTGFVIKPLYSILAFLYVVLLWRQKAPEQVALRWACLWFFIGENFCSLNYLIYNDRSNLFEFLHSLGMVYCFALAIFALVEGIDHRIIKFSDAGARCAAVSLCQRCIKHGDVPCGLERLFLFLIPTLAVLALMPLAAELIPVSYNSKVFGTDYNYTHPVLFQVHEIRYLPLVAIVLLTISFVVLRFKKQERVLWSKVFFVAGAGALGFSFFRLVLFQVYRDNLTWFVAWEELTEFMFMVGVGVVLWAFWRSGPGRHGRGLQSQTTQTKPVGGLENDPGR